MVHTNQVTVLAIISLLIFYLYISKIYLQEDHVEKFSLTDYLKNTVDIIKKYTGTQDISHEQTKSSKKTINTPNIKKMKKDFIPKYPNYIKQYNFILFKDIRKVLLNNNIVSHNEYDKSTYNDELIEELNSMIVPLVNKINRTLNVSFNKENIDYKKVIIKIDQNHNTLYQILLILFQKKGNQKELKIEIHKSNTNKLNINDIKEVSSIHSLPLLQNKNDVNDYYNANFGNDIHDPTHEENKKHFDSKINNNIHKMSKFYNLQSQYAFPTIDEKLHTFDIPDRKVLSGYKDKVLDYGDVEFKVNPNGIQQPSYSYNLWFVDREKEKNITKVFPQNKVSSKWDHTGTLLTTKNSEKDGLDYAYEQRNKIPRFHISQFANNGNNAFNKMRTFTQANT